MSKILGINFFNGEVDQAIDRMCQGGGFLVAPSGTCFARLTRDEIYREAMINADIAIADSGLMVLLWKIWRGETLTRISGWKYLRCLSSRFFNEKTHAVLWIVPNEQARERAAKWLRENNFPFSEYDFYVAPIYDRVVEDRFLLEMLDRLQPGHVVVGVGSGPQEKLGYYLLEHLNYRPSIHCIGAALGFLTGDQPPIPMWADRFYLGWLLRLLRQPSVFIRRSLRALELPFLIARYGEELPPL